LGYTSSVTEVRDAHLSIARGDASLRFCGHRIKVQSKLL
jgi:hypothetical protein